MTLLATFLLNITENAVIFYKWHDSSLPSLFVWEKSVGLRNFIREICEKVEYFRKKEETGVLIIKVSLIEKLI